VCLKNILRLFSGPFRDIRSTPLLPEIASSPIDQLRLRLKGSHVLPSVLMADEVSKGSYLVDNIHCQSLVRDRNSRHHMLNHPCKFVIHHELSPIHGHPHIEHAQAVNEIGACQCRQQGGEGLLMTRLGVRNFAVPLPTRHPAG
jgi:hypothetical protein